MIYAVGTPETFAGLDHKISYQRCTPQQVLEYFQRRPELQVDTESEGLDPHQHALITLQLGDTENQFVIDLRFVPASLFKSLLENKHCLLHNAKHDYKMLKKVGIVLEDIYDTMLAECVIFNGYDNYGYELRDLHKRYLDIELDKEPRRDFARLQGAPLKDRNIKYAARDVANLQRIRDLQKGYIEKFDLAEAVDLENRAVKAIGDIEFNGMWLDTEQWAALAHEKKRILHDKRVEMDKFVLSLNLGYRANGHRDLFGVETRPLEINYGSAPQTLDLLRRAGLPVNSTGAEALEPFGDQELVQKLTDVREFRTLISRYGDAFLELVNPVTGRIHTDFWQMKNTFRLGSSEPNMQNIPRDNAYRNCFKARPGYKLISIDYSGQEMRLMADFSREKVLIDAMNRGEDPHCFVGSMMFDRTITKKDPLRQDAKIVNFGKPYGMGPHKLARKLNSTLEVAEDRLARHERQFPNLDRYLKEQGEFGKRCGYALTNPLHKGRRWFPYIRQAREERSSHNPNWSHVFKIEGSVERAAMNLSIQGSGAVMMKEALVAVRELLKDYDARLVNTVHDEIIMEVIEHQAETVLAQASALMEQVGQRYVQYVKMPVDGKITDYWNK